MISETERARLEDARDSILNEIDKFEGQLAALSSEDPLYGKAEMELDFLYEELWAIDEEIGPEPRPPYSWS